MSVLDMVQFTVIMGMALSGGIFWAFTFFTWLFDEKFDRKPTGFECICIYFIILGVIFALGVVVLDFGGLL